MLILSILKESKNINIRGNPTFLLKAINPSEAILLGPGSNTHVRFRLGGEVFLQKKFQNLSKKIEL